MFQNLRTTIDRTYCHAIARDCLIQAHHESDRAAKRAFLNLSRNWIRLAQNARRSGPISFRAPVQS